MSARDLIDEVRSGARPISTEPRRGNLFDIAATIAAIAAIGALAYVGYGAWFSPKAPRPPVQQVAAVPAAPVEAAAWTAKDDKACEYRGVATLQNPDTGTYMITNRSVSEGVAFLATKVECQIATRPTRFCGADGNAALVAIVNDYIGRMDLIRLGLAAQGAPMAIAGGMLGGEAEAGDAVYSSMKKDTIAYMKSYDTRIAKAVRSLAAQGVVAADDFKPFPFAGCPSGSKSCLPVSR